MFARLCFLLTRLVLPAWVGAGALFVLTGVHEVRSPHIDSITRDRLVLVRFPGYYGFGFALTGMAAVCAGAASTGTGGAAGGGLSVSRRRILAVGGLSLISLLMLAGDWFWVYSPLTEMIDPPGQPRTMRFQTLHHASMYLNSVQLGLCLVAAVLACWESRRAAT